MLNTRPINQRQEILESAIECISKKGYANVSLRHISKEANVALSQVHYYFKTKSNLMSEVIKHYGEIYLDKIEASMEDSPSEIERIGLLLDMVVEVIDDDIKFLKLFFDLLSLSIWDEAAKKHFSALSKELSSIILENLPKNYMGQVYSHSQRVYMANAISGGVFGICIQYLSSVEADKRQVVEESMDEIKRYIRLNYSPIE